MDRRARFLIWITLALLASRSVRADQVVLLVDDVPPSGLAMGRVELTGAAKWCKVETVAPNGILAIGADDRPVPLQFVPDADFDPEKRVAGTVLLRLSKPGAATFRLRFEKPPQASEPPWNGQAHQALATFEHDAKRQGGLPWRILFGATGKKFETLRWNNRLHHREKGSFSMCDDPQAKVDRVSRGPLCTVVRAQSRYVQGGQPTPSQPAATYDWYYFPDQPLVYVAAALTQRAAFEWHEVHFLELNYPREAFPRWAAGEPFQQGEFSVTHKSRPFSAWGAILDGRSAIGMFQCGQVLLYDGGPGTYVQAHGDEAWRPWSDTRKDFSGWLWIGAADQPAAAVQAAAKQPPAGGRMTVSVDTVQARLDAARNEAAPAGPARGDSVIRVAAARRLVALGRLPDAAELLEAPKGRWPKSWLALDSHGTVAVFEKSGGGLRLVEVVDRESGQPFAADRPLPLFSIALRNADTKEEVKLAADAGWDEIDVRTNFTWAGAAIDWRRPADKRLADLVVSAHAHCGRGPGIQWRLSVSGVPAPWSVWRVVFPQVAVADLGPEGKVFFPKAAGEVQGGVWRQPFRFTGTYPSGWTTMQYLAAYNAKAGLYVGVHDPLAATKDILAESRPGEGSVVLAFDHPVSDMGLAGTGSGTSSPVSATGVWRTFRGDWFDAAVIYRDWVRKEAKWYPKLGPEGREDTPPWMRELSVWALGGGGPAAFVPQLKEFARYLDPPVAVHWYNWHQIPFDNDYPHYFPTRAGFADAVRELQSARRASQTDGPVYVMPYINGRLWDTRDKGAEDFEFTKVARPAVSKNEKGEPYTETYGSKEADGSPVRLGAMCPSTELWQRKVRETVLRLYNECGVKGVYIDQVAAAAPTLCFDKSHGHPLGGGHWWTEGYWKMLDAIRKAKPADGMLTTECNGDAYVRCFDGYLTWHWQYDGQVPAFPAVYGGAIQMFGRSYGGGSTKDLALRMRAGQQLVFGEQLGWLGPGVVREQGNADFFRQMVHLRRQLVRYFFAGEMARPPRLAGNVPTVRADWQWGGVDWVTTDAVLAGAWRQPSSNRLVLIFVNVSDGPVSARVDYDLRPYGFTGDLRVRKITPSGPAEEFRSGPQITREATFPARTAWAWEATVP